MRANLRRILPVALAAVAVGLAACDGAAPPTPPGEGASGAPGEGASGEARAADTSLREVLRDPDAFSRARRLGALLPELGPEALPELQEALRDPTLDLGGLDYHLLAEFWAQHDPAAAARWAALQAPPPYGMVAITPTMTAWARVDPKAALVAVQEGGQMPGGRLAEVALVRGWFEGGHPGLEEYIRDLGMGFERQRAVAAYARALIQARGADALIRWAASVPEDDETYKLAVNRQVGGTLPLFDLEAALAWCEAHCDGEYGNGVRTMIAQRWVRIDPEATFAWLWEQPDNQERLVALRTCYSIWGEQDRQAAMAWMAERTEGGPEAFDALDSRVRDLVPLYARMIVVDAPAEAIRWAERMEDDREREFVLTDLAREWRAQDEAAAEAWLEQSELSEEAREKARTPRKRRRGFPG